MTRQRVGRVLRTARPGANPGQPNSLLAAIGEISDLAWLSAERAALRDDFGAIAGKYPRKFVEVEGRLRWRR